MAVDAAEAQTRRLDHAAHRGERVALGHREPELRTLGPGLDVLVGVRLDARGHPHEHLTAVVDPLESVELPERVRYDDPHAGVARRGELGIALVVPVEDEPLGREAGVQRDMQLSSGRHVQLEPLLRDQLGHRDAQERLARVRDVAGAEAHGELAAAGSEMVFVVDEQRGPELGGERIEIRLEQRRRDEGPVEGRGRVRHVGHPGRRSPRLRRRRRDRSAPSRRAR